MIELHMTYYFVGSSNCNVLLRQVGDSVALISSYSETMFESDNAIAIAQFILDLARGAYDEHGPSFFQSQAQ